MNPHHNKKWNGNKFPVSRIVTVVILLALVVIGLASTTFATFVSPLNTGDSGSLIADIQSQTVNRNTKKDIAEIGAVVDNVDTKANVDVAETGLSCTFVFDNSSTNYSNPQIMIGHGSWSEGYLMTQISGTKLWRYTVSGWNDATQIGIMDNASKWGGEGNSVSHRLNYAPAGKTSVISISGSLSGTQLLVGSGLSRTAYSDYKSLNTTQTAQAQYAGFGSSSYSNGTTGGTTTVSSTRVNSSWGSTATTDGQAARTATVTMTATANEGYTFKGWFTSSTATTAESTSTTYTYTCDGSAKTVYARFQESGYSYTVTSGNGGTVRLTSSTTESSSISGTVKVGESVSITATPGDGYTFAGWTGLTSATLGSTTVATTTFKPTANGATVKANFRPDAPTALTLTASNVVSGNGTESNPYIVFEKSAFTLTAKGTVISSATARYSATPDGTYNTINTFTPPITTKGTPLSYTVYSKAYSDDYYSNGYFSATAYYLVFSHLDGANTGFTMSSDNITDADTLTLSGAYVNGVADAEKAYITQTYQISTNNSTFSDLSGSTWKPDLTGTYYFRVKTTNTMTGETVYSSSQSITVTQSTRYYTITVNKATGSGNGTATLKTEGTTITDNQILSNKPLTLALARTNTTPSNYYFTYIRVTDGVTTWEKTNINGDLADTVVIEHVKNDVTIEYCTAVKPLVQPKMPANASSISFKYVSDGTDKTSATAGNYYVDYNSNISYSVTPNTGFYVSAMKGVEIGTITSSTVEGTKSGIKQNVGEVTATLTKNSTFKVNIDTTSDVTTGGSMTIDGTVVSFGVEKPLNYNAQAEVVITPPDGCYAVVSGDVTNLTIDTEGKATFNVTLTNKNKECTVKFVANPKIYMVQPQYGSVYVTDSLGNYYFNDDSVGYGTELTVHTMIDNDKEAIIDGVRKTEFNSCTINSVTVTNNNNVVTNLGAQQSLKFNIFEDSTVSADITMNSNYVFDGGTEYGNRRIFFTDNAGWGSVSVHYSNIKNDESLSSSNVAMTYLYTNEMSQKVFTADIPFSAKYVTFFKTSSTSSKTSQATISNEYNAFWNDNGTCEYWRMVYSDYVATDRADSIQQGVTVKGEAVTFTYTCDYGDDTLSAEVVDGNAATIDFDRGVLSITPTENTKAFTLVKVSSTASTTVKYYLVRVENFEIVDFSGLQKIYSSSMLNNIQLDLIVKGGVLNYAAKLFVSNSNTSGSYEELSTGYTGFAQHKTLEAYINSFLLQNYINNGVKYYKVEASDSANHKATSTLKTLFGTNTYEGTRCVYFYNNTGNNISKYVVRACFNDANYANHRFVTMQKVGNTNYYRAVVPNGFESTVNFYLANPKTFSDNFADYDGTDDSIETYTYGVIKVSIPLTNAANIVFAATEFGDEGIKGEFSQFDY